MSRWLTTKKLGPIITACSILLSSSIGAALTISENNKRIHKTWVIEYVAKRNKLGTFNTLLPELSDGPKYFHYLRMDVDLFEELYTLDFFLLFVSLYSWITQSGLSLHCIFITFSLLNSTCSMLVLLAIFIRRKLRHKYVTRIISR